MADDLKPLKPNDEVYIKSLDALGKVVRVRPGDIGEPEEQRLYEVQIETKYFSRTDLELDTTRDDIEKRKKVEKTVLTLRDSRIVSLIFPILSD